MNTKTLQKIDVFKKNQEFKQKDWQRWIDPQTGGLKEEFAKEENCYVCHAREREKWCIDGPFTVSTCRNCGHKYVSPRLNDTETEGVYNNPDGRWRFNIEAYYEPTLDFRLKEFYPKRIKLIERLTQRKGNILDVGCNIGGFLKVAQDFNWEVYGVEVNRDAAQKAALRIGREDTIFSGQIVDAPFPENFFDVITLWDVIEHLASPNDIISCCYRLLKPGGYIVLDAPHADSFEFDFLGNQAVGVSGDVHLSYFTKKSITLLMHQNDFSVVETSSFGLDISHIIRQYKINHSDIGYNLLEQLEEKLQSVIDEANKGCYIRMIATKAS